MLSQTEENYLKAIYKIVENTKKPANTNAISTKLNTSAASVSDMLKRLAEKKIILYEKYKGVTLSEEGNNLATNLIRKHRLWEVFLVEKLNFSWDEVHEIAEQLEHIKSPELIHRMDAFLDFPRFDPHGDPIPDADGNFIYRKQILLPELKKNESGIIVGVQEHTPQFLQYLDRLELTLGTKIKLIEKFDYDGSVCIEFSSQKQIITSKVCQNLFVKAI